MATPSPNSADYFLHGQGEPIYFLRGKVSTGGCEYFRQGEPFVGIDVFTGVTNTVAPAVTGTPSIGSTLTCNPGTWTGGPTFTYRWQRDSGAGFVNIGGATSSTYVVQSSDVGTSLRCQVTGTAGSVSSSANSNSVAIPAAPVNTAAPTITPAGPYSSLEVVTCDGGSWTGSPVLGYQWFRGASPLAGATNASYTLQVSDEGANIFCRVTAINGGGSAVADSNTIVPQVTSPISDASFLNYYSGGAGNTNPALSIGGARGGTYAGGVSTLFGDIPGSVGQAGGTFYRGVYVRNTHHLSSIINAIVYVRQQYAHLGLHVAVGVPVEAKNVDLPMLADQSTAPAGVTFMSSTLQSNGLAYGDLGPGDVRGLWVRLTVDPGTTATPEDDASLRVEGSAA